MANLSDLFEEYVTVRHCKINLSCKAAIHTSSEFSFLYDTI